MLSQPPTVDQPEPDPGSESSTPGVDAPGVLESLIARAECAGASDIHLQMGAGAGPILSLPPGEGPGGRGAAVFFRLDGVMTPAAELPGPLAERVFGRIKFLARLKTYQESLPQDGRIDKTTVHAASDIRVSTYPTVTGEKIVLRLFSAGEVLPLEQLGFPKDVQSELERFLAQTAGLLLLTGPAGSGKTTTIYSCVRWLAERGGRHIITVEDPAEQIIGGVMQTEVNEAQGLDFAKAARHLLRQDPEVLAIGEIRDEETANIAVRAALTGHLIISTLHAGSCKGVLERLLLLCPDPSAVASAVELVLNQRLLRRRCQACGGKGCSDCLSTGYRGRLAAVELLRMNDTVHHSISAHNLDGISAKPSLRDRAASLIQAGLTNEAEVTRVLGA